MKILAAVMAIAVGLAWSSPGEAQGKRKKARNAAKTHQVYVPPRVNRVCDRVPCVYRNGINFGTDPDPFIRNDLGRDNPFADP